jgi:hypothetical protein
VLAFEIQQVLKKLMELQEHTCIVSIGKAQNQEAKAKLQSLIEESTNTDSKDQKDDVSEEKNNKMGRSSDGAGIGLKLGLCVYRRLVEAQN